MQKRPQTTHPGSRPEIEAPELRPQTHQMSKRNAGTKSSQVLPPVNQKKPKSALPLKAPQIRMAIPGMQQYDVSGKHWEIVSKQTEALLGNQAPGKLTKRPMTAYPASNKPFTRGSEDPIMSSSRPLQSFEEKLQEEARSRAGPLQPKPFSFLSKLGGNVTHAGSLVKPESQPGLELEMETDPQRQQLTKVATMPVWGPGVVTAEVEIGQERKELLTIFTNYDVDDYVKEARKKPASRLVSAQARMKGEGARPISSYVKKSQPRIELKSHDVPFPPAASKRPFSAFPG